MLSILKGEIQLLTATILAVLPIRMRVDQLIGSYISVEKTTIDEFV